MLVDLIRAAIADRLDGNVGIVLSGGLDSSTVAMLAPESLPAFTGYYDVPGFDERHYARLAARGVHHEILITAEDFVEHFEAAALAMRQPYQGMGAFGQFMVARYAAQHVAAVVSGEGSDELFGGYARTLLAAGEPLPAAYAHYQPPADYPIDDLEAALQYDLDRLPDLLAVDDQMCGAWGLVSRAPFTDERIVDYALRLPAKERVGKRHLRRAVRGLVPDEIVDRTGQDGLPDPAGGVGAGRTRSQLRPRPDRLPPRPCSPVGARLVVRADRADERGRLMDDLRAAYQASYEQIAHDHLARWRETGENPFMATADIVQFDDATAALLVKHVQAGSRVLDVGCGMGNVLGRLPQYERHGIDIVADFVEIARERGIDAIVGEVESLPYPDASFDAVLAIDIFEHVLDPNVAAAEILRVLRPGGAVLVRTPNAEDMAGYVDLTLYPYCHLRRWDEPTWRLFWTRIYRLPVIEVVVVKTEINVLVRKAP